MCLKKKKKKRGSAHVKELKKKNKTSPIPGEQRTMLSVEQERTISSHGHKHIRVTEKEPNNEINAIRSV